MPICKIEQARRAKAARPLQGYDPPDSRPVPIDGPAETGVRIDGRAYRVQTWTWAQWDRLPRKDRPGDAWRQGTVWMRIVPC